ncbi:hypothetical protein JTB14_012797 [Gonioctena quinquepunctata]|nr:hypothetical protein JTB14_012797 [Gonioctena quinquepunctata]
MSGLGSINLISVDPDGFSRLQKNGHSDPQGKPNRTSLMPWKGCCQHPGGQGGVCSSREGVARDPPSSAIDPSQGPTGPTIQTTVPSKWVDGPLKGRGATFSGNPSHSGGGPNGRLPPEPEDVTLTEIDQSGKGELGRDGESAASNKQTEGQTPKRRSLPPAPPSPEDKRYGQSRRIAIPLHLWSKAQGMHSRKKSRRHSAARLLPQGPGSGEDQRSTIQKGKNTNVIVHSPYFPYRTRTLHEVASLIEHCEDKGCPPVGLRLKLHHT